jgi:ABC-type transporter MlaC component
MRLVQTQKIYETQTNYLFFKLTCESQTKTGFCEFPPKLFSLKKKKQQETFEAGIKQIFNFQIYAGLVLGTLGSLATTAQSTLIILVFTKKYITLLRYFDQL